MATQESWHLDKRVPLALIVAIAAQTFGLGWWAATLSERVAVLEKEVSRRADTVERIGKIETHLIYIRRSIDDFRLRRRGATD